MNTCFYQSRLHHPTLWLLFITLPLQSAWAAENEGEEEQAGSQWGLGLGARVMQQAYRDIDAQNIVIPLIIYNGKWISFNGGTLSLKLPDAGPVSFALVADLSRDGYEASDSIALTGMAEREDNLWLGGLVAWENRIANLSASWTSDVSGFSEGQKFSLSATRNFEYGRFEFMPRLTTEWLDDKYVNYYYGVKTSEATTNRSFYAPESTVNIQAGFRTTFNVAPRKSLFLDLSVDSLGAEIKDSPIVDDSTVSRIALGYVHRF
jgi:MipA family protein